MALKWGRHFRINENYKAIVGRDKDENVSLVHYAHPDDHIMLLAENEGPTVLLKGNNPPENILALAGGLVQNFSKYKQEPSRTIKFWLAKDCNSVNTVIARKLTEQQINQMYI